MSTLGTFLRAAAGPLARKVLQSLGVGMVTFVGLDAAVSALLTSAKDAIAGNPFAEVAAVLAIAGFNTALAMVAGAITARVAMVTLKRWELRS